MADDIIIQKLQDHDKRFDKIESRLDTLTITVDKLTVTALEHGERLDQMVTKTEFNEFRKEQSTANDQIMTILKRIDEERFATIGWLRRIEDEVEEQKKKTQEH